MKTITSLLLALTLLSLSSCTTGADGKPTLDQAKATAAVNAAANAALNAYLNGGKGAAIKDAAIKAGGAVIAPKDETTVPAAPVGEVTK